ncbi:hypothetical protein [uncultured Methanobrevibacter sp.]|uniref:hypothetical protein n=1 Tax=uncultured Methanobrevibacter sp. TaxID=253161 RepID=UPI002633C763
MSEKNKSSDVFYMDKSVDKELKDLMRFDVDDVLEGLKIPHKFEKLVSPEILGSDGKAYFMDYAFIDTDGNLVDLEFESKIPNAKDKIRYLRYAANSNQAGKKNFTYVVCTEDTDLEDLSFNWHHNDWFTIPVHMLKHKNGNKTLNRIKEKIKNKEGFNKEDIIDLKTIAFMDLEDKSLDDVILEVLTLMNEIQDDYGYDLVFGIKKTNYVFGRRYIKNEEKRKQLERLFVHGNMIDRLIRQRDEDIHNDGKLEGKMERTEEFVIKMLDMGFSFEVISEISGLDFEEIDVLKKDLYEN